MTDKDIEKIVKEIPNFNDACLIYSTHEIRHAIQQAYNLGVDDMRDGLSENGITKSFYSPIGYFYSAGDKSIEQIANELKK